MQVGDDKLRQRLVDLLAWGEKVERVARGTSADAILVDEIAELALSRAVEVVGEIAGRLMAEFPEWSDRHDRKELTGAYRTRNRLAHGYDSIGADVLYVIAIRDVRRLTEKARNWLAELDAEQP